ncbi:autotransporter domain-containing protein [Reyranella sp. CPCC 100927]|uniref:autotransporter outer membrane beta-barrel domain-containing protein n=1 Tax=Reyranella sp. CPCC 100927 TaxID=2599616 RepID=UPI0011B82EEA|nr:autotransporter domain-containing protein [Reyranella sp. CPCC 100927]TWT13958.1 autotransporter outer membrane beta-barrel domain-containing protein [Reyranella sp. CPCC 100927]
MVARVVNCHSGEWTIGRGRLLAGISVTALAIGCWFPASAADFPAGTDQQLRDAIAAANASPDPTSTITLTGSFAVANSVLPTITKPITINMQGFTLLGIYNAATTSAVGAISVANNGTLTLAGTGAIVGGTGGPAGTAVGQTGLHVNTGSVVTNNVSVTGGAGGGAGTAPGGLGAQLLNNATLINEGTITGGNASTGGGGSGIRASNGATIINHGTIQGGSSTAAGGTGGNGVEIGSQGGNPTSLTNTGTIRGGNGPTTGSTAVLVRVNTGPIVNSGTIEGGIGAGGISTAASVINLTVTNSGTIAGGAAGGVGIITTGTVINFAVTNSGTIRAGSGGANAITTTANTSTLELQPGSIIIGNVIVSAAGTNDTLRLGGTGTDTFDVSAVGTQYQNFDRFEKTGTGTWILTGNGTVATPWQIQAGTLQIGNGGTTGSIIGDAANDGTLAFNRSDTLVHAGIISGGGSVSQIGTGTTVLTAANTYTGGTTISAGRLQLGDGGTTGSIAGDVINNGIFAFNRSDVVTFAGIISGSGAVEHNGAGTTTLTGANTYAGGTVFNAGTLAVAADANLGAAGGGLAFNGGTLQNTAAFATARTATLDSAGGTLQTDADLALSGVIAGTGGLTKTGTGTLTLTGNNTYAGATTISAGILQLGNGGTSGAIAGDVVNNATLALNRSDTLVLAGTITGSGALQQNGAGTTVLTAANTYGGGTTINAGTLQLGNGGTSGAIAGAIANNGTLAFNRSDAVTFAGAISGSGGVRQIGSGTTVLTGTSTYTGGTTVEAGRLAVNGSIASVVSVTGGALAGTGTVGGIVANSGSTVAPGNSIGTLNVAGNVSFAPGATYEVEIEPSGTGDLLHATGTAALTGGTVSVVKAGGTYAIGSRYTILTADAGVSGTFSGLTQNLPFLNLALTYDPGNVYLDVTRNSVAFCDVAASRNQCATGRGAESLGAGNAVYDAIASLPDAAAARQAFNALSGEIHASTRSVLIDESRYLRDAVVGRTAQAGTAGGAAPQFAALAQMNDQAQRPQDGTAITAWMQAFGAWGHIGGDGNAARADRSTGGLFVGADTTIDGTWTVGLATGYSRTTLDVDGRNSRAAIDSYHLALYGGARFGAVGVRVGAAHTWHSIDTTRGIAFGGFTDSTKADYNARTTQLFGDVGYTLALGSAAIEPFGSLAWVHLDSNRVSESGGAAALRGRGGSDSNLFTTLGVRAAAQVWNDESKSLTLRGKLGWRHAFGDVTPAARLAFVGGTSFGVEGVPIARDAVVVEAGFDLKIGKSLTVGAAYAGVLSGDAQDHSIKGNLAYRF